MTMSDTRRAINYVTLTQLVLQSATTTRAVCLCGSLGSKGEPTSPISDYSHRACCNKWWANGNAKAIFAIENKDIIQQIICSFEEESYNNTVFTQNINIILIFAAYYMSTKTEVAHVLLKASVFILITKKGIPLIFPIELKTNVKTEWSLYSDTQIGKNTRI